MKLSYLTLKSLKRKITSLVLLLICGIAANAQSIWSNTIDGTNPNTSNPLVAGNVVNPNITVSGIGRGAGIAGTNANNRYNANGWNSASFDANDYFEFTLTPNNNYEINLSSFVYSGQASGTGPGNFAFRSSLDGFTANLGTPTATGATITLTALPSITAPVTFRLYAWGASSATGTFSVNDFTFNGTTPLPVTFASFTASREQQSVLLQWSTGMEKNVSHFELERSADGEHFAYLARVTARNQATGSDYRYTDKITTSTSVYYRLKTVDTDGRSAYSPVAAIRGDAATLGTKLEANPVRNTLPVSFAGTSGSVELYIVNLAGVVLQRRTVTDASKVNLDVTGLTPGLYLLQVKASNSVESFKFVKQ